MQVIGFAMIGVIGGSRMDDTAFYTSNKDFLQQCIEKQQAEDYHRNLDGSYEPVSYLPGSSIRFWVNNEPSEYETHWHPAIELIFPIKNTYTVIVGQETHHLQPGDIFIIPAGELHHLIAPPSGLRLIYLFDFSVLSKIRGYSHLSSYLSQPVLINSSTCGPIYEETAQNILKLCADYFNDETLRDLTIYARLLSLFVTYGQYRMSLEDTSCYSPANASKQKDLMDKLNIVFDYLDEHFAEDITLEKVADVAGFSKFHFSRLFKQCSGYNFYDYLCFRRIKSAETLLLKPGISITEVALQSGFSSLSTFNRTFKKLKNCTPSEYRSLFSSQLDPFY